MSSEHESSITSLSIGGLFVSGLLIVVGTVEVIAGERGKWVLVGAGVVSLGLTWMHGRRKRPPSQRFAIRMVLPPLLIGLALLTLAGATAVAEVAGTRPVALVYAGCGATFVYVAIRVRRLAMSASLTDDVDEEAT